MIGQGYKEARFKRMSSGLTASEIEKTGNEEFLVYFGRAHVIDHETNVESRGPLKVGRAKFKTALARGRNQPGIDFRIYAEIIVSTNQDTRNLEKIAHKILRMQSIVGSQNQQELFDVADKDIADWVNTIVDDAKFHWDMTPVEINFYLDRT